MGKVAPDGCRVQGNASLDKNRTKESLQREREEQESGKKKRGRKPKPVNDIKDESKANTTDPESRILKTRKGYVQGYNGQAMADCDSQVIVAQDITQQENDVNQLLPMLQRCEEQAERRPEVGLFDAGYWSEENALAGGDTELYIATLKDHKQRKAIKEQRAPRGRKPQNLSPREEMERKLLTKVGKETYKLRGSTIEPVFGQMSTRVLAASSCAAWRR